MRVLFVAKQAETVILPELLVNTVLSIKSQGELALEIVFSIVSNCIPIEYLNTTGILKGLKTWPVPTSSRS